MKKTLITVASGLLTAASFIWAAPSALAERPRVEWSISMGVPGYYPPPAVYSQPQGFYGAPSVVYAEQYPAPHYGHHERDWQERQWRKRQWREQQWREQQLLEQQLLEQQWRERRWRRHHGHHGHHD